MAEANTRSTSCHFSSLSSYNSKICFFELLNFVTVAFFPVSKIFSEQWRRGWWVTSRGHGLRSNLVGTNGFNGGRLSKDESDGRQGDVALSHSFSRASLMGFDQNFVPNIGSFWGGGRLSIENVPPESSSSSILLT
eukprot:13281307-Ditylum_brightwellii.AAC.1